MHGTDVSSAITLSISRKFESMFSDNVDVADSPDLTSTILESLMARKC